MFLWRNWIEGEVFGGIDVDSECNDGEVLMRILGECGGSRLGNGRKSVPEVLSLIKGPWALIYWQVKFQERYYGRPSVLMKIERQNRRGDVLSC